MNVLIGISLLINNSLKDSIFGVSLLFFILSLIKFWIFSNVLSFGSKNELISSMNLSISTCLLENLFVKLL